jgi:hypothetical protein
MLDATQLTGRIHSCFQSCSDTCLHLCLCQLLLLLLPCCCLQSLSFPAPAQKLCPAVCYTHARLLVDAEVLRLRSTEAVCGCTLRTSRMAWSLQHTSKQTGIRICTVVISTCTLHGGLQQC